MLIRLVAVLLAFGPGALLGLAVPPGRDRWVTWACAPILSLGLTSIGVIWLPALGLPNGTTAVLVTELLVAAAAILASRLVAARAAPATPPLRPWPARSRRLPVRDLVAVAVPAVVALGFGRLMLGEFRFPIGWDSMNHAVLTGNILQTGSTAISDACATGSTLPKVACNFYPLAVDVSWAQAANLSGGPISRAMTTWLMVVGPLAVVAAVYTIVRVMGGRRIIASCAAGASIVVGTLWEQQLDGRVTGAIPAFGVMIALLIALAVKGRHPVRLGLLAGLASAGLLMTHTYDAYFAATFALAVIVTLRGRLRSQAAVRALGAAAIAAALVMVPALPDLLGAGTGRPTRAPRFAGHLWSAVNYWIIDVRRYAPFSYPIPGSIKPLPDLPAVHIALWLTVPCLIAAPLCFVFAHLRWGRPWVITWAFWTLVGIWTTTSRSGLAASLAHTWYGDSQRLHDMIFLVYPVMAVAGACAIGTGLELGLTRLRPHLSGSAWTPALPAALAVVLVVPLLGLAALPDTGRQLRTVFGRYTPRNAAYPRVYAWLAAHTPKSDVVAWNRNVEFFPWAFSDYGVRPLFGIPALVAANRPNEIQRYETWDWLVDNGQGNGQPQGCLVRAFRVKYVVTSNGLLNRTPGAYQGQYKHPTIAKSPNLVLVHKDGPIRVFAITARGQACPPSG